MKTNPKIIAQLLVPFLAIFISSCGKSNEGKKSAAIKISDTSTSESLFDVVYKTYTSKNFKPQANDCKDQNQNKPQQELGGYDVDGIKLGASLIDSVRTVVCNKNFNKFDINVSTGDGADGSGAHDIYMDAPPKSLVVIRGYTSEENSEEYRIAYAGPEGKEIVYGARKEKNNLNISAADTVAALQEKYGPPSFIDDAKGTYVIKMNWVFDPAGNVVKSKNNPLIQDCSHIGLSRLNNCNAVIHADLYRKGDQDPDHLHTTNILAVNSMAYHLAYNKKSLEATNTKTAVRGNEVIKSPTTLDLVLLSYSLRSEEPPYEKIADEKTVGISSEFKREREKQATIDQLKSKYKSIENVGFIEVSAPTLLTGYDKQASGFWLPIFRTNQRLAIASDINGFSADITFSNASTAAIFKIDPTTAENFIEKHGQNVEIIIRALLDKAESRADGRSSISTKIISYRIESQQGKPLSTVEVK